jgi:hypothetical protein
MDISTDAPFLFPEACDDEQEDAFTIRVPRAIRDKQALL